MSIKITSHKDADEVDIGELTINGISSDSTSTDCIVEVDWNNQKPYQIVTPTGPGGQGDYSTWTFTYSNEYKTIKPGNNELTSKLTCINPGPLAEWYSVTVIGKNATSIISSSSTNSGTFCFTITANTSSRTVKSFFISNSYCKFFSTINSCFTNEEKNLNNFFK